MQGRIKSISIEAAHWQLGYRWIVKSLSTLFELASGILPRTQKSKTLVGATGQQTQVEQLEAARGPVGN